MVNLLATGFCLMISIIGLAGVMSPKNLVGFMRQFQNPKGLYGMAALRLVMGAVLFMAADASRYPQAVQGLGVFIFVAGVITPFLGVDRFKSILDWFSEQGDIFVRVWAGFAFLFGVLLAATVAP